VFEQKSWEKRETGTATKRMLIKTTVSKSLPDKAEASGWRTLEAAGILGKRSKENDSGGECSHPRNLRSPEGEAPTGEKKRAYNEGAYLGTCKKAWRRRKAGTDSKPGDSARLMHEKRLDTGGKLSRPGVSRRENQSECMTLLRLPAREKKWPQG